MTALLLALLAGPAAAQGSPEAAPAGRYPSGIFSHGDSGDFVEDAYGRPPERAPPADEAGRRKRDPAVLRQEPTAGR